MGRETSGRGNTALRRRNLCAPFCPWWTGGVSQGSSTQLLFQVLHASAAGTPTKGRMMLIISLKVGSFTSFVLKLFCCFSCG